MKKIIALAVVAITLVSATFALDFELGAKVIAGQNVVEDATAKDTIKGLNADSSFEFGGAVYANFALFGGLGVQIEPTLIKSNVNFNLKGQELNVNQDYEVMTLDIPVMVWLNLDLWKLTIGAGAGVDYSMEVTQDATVKEIAAGAANGYKRAFDEKSSLAWIVGVDGKFYLTNHIGVVASVRYIMDITKKNVPVEVNGYEVPDVEIPTLEYGRRFLYGGVGLEFKLF